MSSVDVALWAIIGAIGGGLAIWFLIYAFSGQTTAPSNLTKESLKRRLFGSVEYSTSSVTQSTGTVFVNSEEFSAKSRGETIEKGARVKVIETDGLTLVVENA